MYRDYVGLAVVSDESTMTRSLIVLNSNVEKWREKSEVGKNDRRYRESA